MFLDCGRPLLHACDINSNTANLSCTLTRCYVGKARLNSAVEALKRADPNAKVSVSFTPYMIDPQTQPNGEDYLAYNERRWGGDGWTASLKRCGS